jgi:hypothetical protein
VAVDADPEGAQELLGEGSGGHAGGRLPGAGALEHVADVAVAELERAGEIGVARSRQVRLLDLGLDRPGVHALVPVRVVLVRDQDRDRAAQGVPVTDPGADLDRVALDLHPAAAPVTALTAPEKGVDGGPVHDHPRRHSLHDDGESGAMRLACGQEAQTPNYTTRKL